MTNYEKLVEALRCGEYKPECGSSDCPYWSGLGCMDGQLMEDAAAAIEALLKENKELIEDGPEMVETDGHWEWRKPNGEVLMPKRGEIVRCRECKWYSIYEAKKDGSPDKRYSPSVCLREIYAKRRDPDWFCADGEREVQE